MLASDQSNKTGKENLKQICTDIVVNFSSLKRLLLGLTLTGLEKTKF
jgi:hypothetical protein